MNKVYNQTLIYLYWAIFMYCITAIHLRKLNKLVLQIFIYLFLCWLH